ncbi:MAG: putative bifunctional diguanylate cyclase/phosphodiesterase [Solirubrobacteraceae bacterium]
MHAKLPVALVVDDDPFVCQALGEQLKRRFSLVATAGDADSAIALARRHNPDLALVDVEMPGGGLHAARGIRDGAPDTTVVILTADRARASVLQFLDAGAMAYLRKDMPFDQLLAQLDQAMVAHGTRTERAGDRREAATDGFRAAFDAAGGAMAIVALEGSGAGRLVEVNRAFGLMLGVDAGALVGDNLEKWTHPDDLPDGVRDPLTRLARGDAEQIDFGQRYLHSDGHVVDALGIAASYVDAGSGRVAIIQVLDVSARKRLEGQVERLTDHDMLTGLPNRRRFEAELDHELIRTVGHEGRVAVLAIHLNGLKIVSDSLGHAIAEGLFVTVAGRLRRTVRPSDIVARTGGDEFGVILPGADEPAAMRMAEKILDAISLAATTSRGRRSATIQSATIATSVGVTVFEDGDRLLADEVIVEADMAMYDAKASGANRISVYARDQRRRTRVDVSRGWRHRLQRAIEDESFVLHAQPIVPVCSAGAPRFELLLRMPDDNGELIAPATFLYYAERFGLIQQIDEWVMTQAVRLLHEHQAQGNDISLAINISGKTLNAGTIGGRLRSLLEASPVPGGRLMLELTETAAIANIDRARELAHYLRELGCRLALDDFGAGFASFYYLKHLEFDCIKIDGEFIKRLPQTPSDQLIVRAVVDIARGLSAETIAEFVQDDETLALLRELGVDYAQGYHTGRPASLDSILPRLRTDTTFVR